MEKFTELNGLKLDGYTCYFKDISKKPAIYHLKKKEGNGYFVIKSYLIDIEYCIEHGISLP